MRKATLVLLAGAVCGAAATLLLADTRPAATTGDTSFLGALSSLAGRGTSRDADAVRVSERLAAYRSAAAHDEPAVVEAALERVALAKGTAARDLEIDALLARLGELDAERAARAAQRLALDARFVADAWLTWAEQDADAALAALGTSNDSSARRAAALALLDVFGDSLAAIERVAAALPAGDRATFEVDALAYKAERNPYGAFRDALALPDAATRRRAAQEVATVWARIDPEGAVAETALAPDDIQRDLQQAVAAEWARLDAAGFIRSLSTIDLNGAGSGLSLALATDPEGVIRETAGLQSALATALRSTAMAALAQIDVEAAKAHVAALPPGRDRNQALQQVASAYARADPEGALAWAESLGAPTDAIRRSIMLGIAASGDVDRAMLAIGRGDAGPDSELMISLVASRAAQDPREARKLATDLVGKSDAQSKALLARLASTWVQREPEGALEWALSQGAAIDAATIGNMASTFASRDATAAAAYTDRLPPQLRPTWLTQVAGPYARFDPAGAMRWLDRYQGQQGYDVALRQMATQAAQTDPRTAAAMLERANADVQLGAAQTVASSWARMEPEAAARWAATLTDPRARARAIAAAATAWASADAPAAEAWALSLSLGAPRDDALLALLPRRLAAGEPLDGRLLAAFSSAQARESAIERVYPTLRARDPAEAQRVLDAYVTDPLQRQRLEQLPPARTVIDPTGSVILLR